MAFIYSRLEKHLGHEACVSSVSGMGEIAIVACPLLGGGVKWALSRCREKEGKRQEPFSHSCNPVLHSPYMHIDVRFHFPKEKVEKGIVELFFVRTEFQLTDLFTKALSEDRFKYLVRRLGMRCLTPEELEVLANASA
ncbi:hypothetical protein Tco_0652606 [Tanacetum coccineum]|uniref:Retrovirus-related Pol polyprotein from transposon TNT 1-94 n=1 Tax=Tanacetum coccineum TaxID=301880 RepID=A0ABQ4WY14_9ASTR